MWLCVCNIWSYSLYQTTQWKSSKTRRLQSEMTWTFSNLQTLTNSGILLMFRMEKETTWNFPDLFKIKNENTNMNTLLWTCILQIRRTNIDKQNHKHPQTNKQTLKNKTQKHTNPQPKHLQTHNKNTLQTRTSGRSCGSNTFWCCRTFRTMKNRLKNLQEKVNRELWRSKWKNGSFQWSSQ